MGGGRLSFWVALERYVSWSRDISLLSGCTNKYSGLYIDGKVIAGS
jgi:hypothetical protein